MSMRVRVRALAGQRLGSSKEFGVAQTQAAELEAPQHLQGVPIKASRLVVRA